MRRTIATFTLAVLTLLSTAIVAQTTTPQTIYQVGPDRFYKTPQAAITAAEAAGGVYNVIEIVSGEYRQFLGTVIHSPITIRCIGSVKLVVNEDNADSAAAIHGALKLQAPVNFDGSYPNISYIDTGGVARPAQAILNPGGVTITQNGKAEKALGGISLDSSGIAALSLNVQRIMGRTGPKGFVLDSMFVLLRETGNTDTLGFALSYGTSLTGSTTSIVADTLAGVAPNITTGKRQATFSTAIIPASRWLFFTLTKRSGATKEFMLMLEGYTP